MAKINELFEIERGRGSYLEKLGEGMTPIVSSTRKNNGVVRYVDLEPTFNAPAITVDRVTGQSFVQLHPFATVPDDITVLVPKKELPIEELFYVANVINLHKWRFSYGRKLTPTRLRDIEIDFIYLPKYSLNLAAKLPEKTTPKKLNKLDIQFEIFNLTDIFKLHSGDFHNAGVLDEGEIPLISCGDENNGIIKFVNAPLEKTYTNTLTIAYNGQPLTTKYHPYNFAAKDDVAVCIPKKKIMPSTFIFIQYVLNREKWRYSYGRKCFREKLNNFSIYLPVDSSGRLNEPVMKEIISTSPYWNFLKKTFTEGMKIKGDIST